MCNKACIKNNSIYEVAKHEVPGTSNPKRMWKEFKKGRRPPCTQEHDDLHILLKCWGNKEPGDKFSEYKIAYY